VEAWFRAPVKSLKANANHNESIGDALSIEGARQSAPDLTTLKPEIDVQISGNRVEVDRNWQGNAAFLDLCEILVDRGDGKGFVLLARHHAGLCGHRAVSRRPHAVDLQGHLPRGRCANRPTRQLGGRWRKPPDKPTARTDAQ
jgi:hypothetical protein